MDKITNESTNIEIENLKKILELFPEVFVDGKVDFKIFKELFGEYASNENERYSFEWNGKKNTKINAQKPSVSTLLPQKEKGLNWDTTNNIYIEGDNEEVLKVLQKTFYGKVKMIYIDPPYNTGEDFVYPDNYSSTIQNYKEIIGKKNSANPDSSGRYHTDWLNMMYSRIFLAKQLLTNDGVIFISISDHEFYNLKMICDEIFGEYNYLGDIIWNSTKSVTNTALLSVSHTYNLVYFKNMDYFTNHRTEFRLPDSMDGFSNPDNDPRGPWKADPFQVGGWRPNQQYEIINPKTGVVYRPNSGCSWKNDYKNFKLLMDDNRIVFGVDGTAGPQRKRFASDALERGKVAKSIWDDIETTTNGTQLVKKMFDNVSVFSNPKPLELITRFLELGANKDCYVMDFFSGSATTAHAVLNMNVKNNTKIKFILVQLPELLDETDEAFKLGYKNICQIGEDRIRKSIDLIKKDNNLLYDVRNIDLGFKVFKLESTNIVPWDSSIKLNEEGLMGMIDVIKEGRTNLDVAYEIMLKYGVFNMPLKEITINGKTMFSVGEDYMIICLDNQTTLSDVEEIGKLKPHCVVFKDSGFKDDNVKLNGVKTLQTYGVKDIKSL